MNGLNPQKHFVARVVNCKFVAQVGNLLFRRLAVGCASETCTVCGLPIRDTADCQSALP